MRRLLRTMGMAGWLSVAAWSQAQNVPTAEAKIQLFAFGAASANFTGVALAKNLDVTGGLDLEFRSFATLYPALEVRGTYPIGKGNIDDERNVLAGLRLGRHVHPFSPYGDILFGRGQINYPHGYPTADGTLEVISSASNVISFGGGTDISFNSRWAAKGDFQFQRYQSPVTTSGYVYSKVFSVGVVYRIGARGLR